MCTKLNLRPASLPLQHCHPTQHKKHGSETVSAQASIEATHVILLKRNMQSAYEHPLPVEEYLAIECTAGRVVDPLPIQTFPHAKIRPFGVIPKCN